MSNTVFVTGGAYGTGYAIAERFAKEGYTVFISGRDEEKVNISAKKLADTYNIKAKGFKNALVVIGEKDVNVIVDTAPDTSKTLQIQDAVLSKTDFTAADIKIISADENS